jgi:release factor glutamine methyltransferase
VTREMTQVASYMPYLIPGEFEIETLKRLPARLAREGFVDAYTIYGAYNSRIDCWSRDLHLLPVRLQTLFRLFLLGQPVDMDAVSGIFANEEVRALERLSILRSDGQWICSGNLVAIPIQGYLILTNRPSVDPVVYFGEDSAAMAVHLFPLSGGVGLDLCSGPGIQALLASSRAQRVVAVEINPAAAAFAHLNIVMNNVEERVEVRTGDLYHAVPGAEFDFIIANPPLLPFPEGLRYPFVGHGGGDGLAITRRIISGLPKALRPGGLCQIIGTCLGNASGPICETELSELAQELGLNIVMTVPAAKPLEPDSPMFNGMTWSCSAASSLPLEEVRNRFDQHLRRAGANYLHLFFLTISKTNDRGELRITQHYRNRSGFWFV